MYTRVVTDLGPSVQRQWAAGAAVGAPTAFHVAPPLPDLPEPSPSEQVVSSADSLMTLAGSNYEDQRKEAVSGLVALSTLHAPVLVEAPLCFTLILVLLKLLTSNNLLDIVRGSAVCLAALLKAYSDRVAARTAGAKQQFTAELGQSLTSTMMELLQSPALLEYLDTKRYISSSLQSIAKAHPSLVLKYRPTLTNYANSKDPVLRTNVQKTLQLIAV
jgi:hypothetical protein